MASNAPQTMQPPPIPSTPVVAQQALNELVDYYYQLAAYHRSSIDYYQQLVEQHSSEVRLVEKQLASIKALLDPLTENGATNQKTNEPVKPEDTASLTDAKPELNVEVEPEVASVARESDDISSNGKTTTTETTADEVEVSEGSEAASAGQTINSDSKSKQNTKEESKAKSQTKSSSSKASNVKKSRSKAKKVKAYSSRLPNSPLLEPYDTIADAVIGCLQEYYPRVMSADDILKHYYPQGLTGETKKRAYGAFSNTLSKGAGNKGWIRESIGKYRWREGI